MAEQPDNTIEEVSLLLFLMNRDRFFKFGGYISKLNLEGETKNFLSTIREYFNENTDAQDVSMPEFLTYFTIKHPILRKRPGYVEFMERLSTCKINSRILEENLNNFVEKYIASEMVLKLTEVLDGNTFNAMPDIQALLNEYEDNRIKLTKSESELFVKEGLAELMQQLVYEDGIKWRLNCLNEDIGDLRGRSLGHVFARVDAGKTSFIISELTHMASQLKDDEIVLWCNNEEAGTKVKYRIYQAVLGKSNDEMQKMPVEEAERLFDERGGNRIRIYDEAILSVEEIEQLCLDFNVRVLVIDQGDKVKFHGQKDYSTVERLKILYGKFRELAKKCKKLDVITVGQADGASEGKKWLNTTNMDFSKTGKPGELDYAIAIGKTQSDEDNGRSFLRHINVCKNKMKNGVHGKHSVHFDSLRAVYTDLN